jgi:hypothetical protein
MDEVDQFPLRSIRQLRIAKAPEKVQVSLLNRFGCRAVKQLEDDELTFLIQIGRTICQSRFASRNAALLDKLRAKYDRRYQQQDTSRNCHSRKRKPPLSPLNAESDRPVMSALNIVP